MSPDTILFGIAQRICHNMQRLNRCDCGGNKVAVLEQTAGILPNFIGGEWHKSGASDFVDVFNPATGEVLAKAPLATAEVVNAAVTAAAAAFPAWRRTPPQDRIQYLFKLRSLLEQHAD